MSYVTYLLDDKLLNLKSYLTIIQQMNVTSIKTKSQPKY